MAISQDARLAITKGKDYTFINQNRTKEMLPGKQHTQDLLDALKESVTTINRCHVEGNFQTRASVYEMWEATERLINCVYSHGIWKNIDAYTEYAKDKHPNLSKEGIISNLLQPLSATRDEMVFGSSDYTPPAPGLASMPLNHDLENDFAPDLYRAGLIDEASMNKIERLTPKIRDAGYCARDIHENVNLKNADKQIYPAFKDLYETVTRSIPDKTFKASLPKLVDDKTLDTAKKANLMERTKELIALASDTNNQMANAEIATVIIQSLQLNDDDKNTIFEAMMS